MATIRVHELAKDMNMASKDLLGKLQTLGLNVKNHMSTIPSGESERIKKMVLNLDKDNAGTNKPREQKPAHNFAKQVKNGDADKNKSQYARPQHNNKEIKNQHNYRNNNSVNNKQVRKETTGDSKPKEKTFNDPAELLNKAEKAVGQKAFERGGKKKTPSRKPSRFDDNKRSNRRPGKNNKNRRNQHFKREKAEPVLVKKVTLEGTLTVQDFAHLINKKASEVIKKLMGLGVLATINQEIDIDTLILLGGEFNVTVDVKATKDEILNAAAETTDAPEDLQERPPVVTIMGHVDHGKTSLLDVIRHTNVTATEAGGITQHIGAYQVEVEGKKITFLDTPGHEAFTAMRARGAQITDIAILVVAADDGVKPQTIEAINHAQAAKVPIIVAINKTDKPEANPERIKQELTEYGLIPEEWGGETICVNVSAKTKEGLESLLEMILLVSEITDIKANPNRFAKGSVVEAKLDKGRGPVATVLVENGTLNVGDYLVVGYSQGRIRAMQDDKGRNQKTALPSTPVEVIGLDKVPRAGDVFHVVSEERLAKQIIDERIAHQKEETQQARARISLDDLFLQIKEGDVKELNIIIKADVQGSIEAIKQSLEKLSTEEVRVNIIHQGVGAINETDVMLADASNAIIIGFNVRPDANARKVAENQKIDIRLYRVIYDAIEDIKAAMSGLLQPDLREVVLGAATVRATFKVPKIGTIAGCYVTDGKIVRNAQVRVVRDGVVIHEGNIDSLKRFKDDAKEVSSGYECGIGLEKFNDIHVDDTLEAFTIEEVKRELD